MVAGASLYVQETFITQQTFNIYKNEIMWWYDVVITFAEEIREHLHFPVIGLYEMIHHTT